MTLPRHGKTLDVYIETDESQLPASPRSTYQESEISKMTFFNVFNPEWAVGVLRRTRSVKRVIDFGSAQDDDTHHALKVIFEKKNVRDIKAFRNMIRYVIENANLHETHL